MHESVLFIVLEILVHLHSDFIRVSTLYLNFFDILYPTLTKAWNYVLSFIFAHVTDHLLYTWPYLNVKIVNLPLKK